MSEAKSYRKPYKRQVKAATWWLDNPFYVRYMLREGTAVMALFAALEIALGIFLFGMCALDSGEITPETTAPYMWWVQDFLGNPLIILLNLAALGAQLFHMVTWFNLMPKAVRVFMNKNSTDLLPDYVTKIGLYGGAAGGAFVILVAAFVSAYAY